ncbi:MAG TPA: MFS transporter, partial [Thermoleophilaceae bacterium]|nr:MFS transporter [Thermoleophilaceae bacterium]
MTPAAGREADPPARAVSRPATSASARGRSAAEAAGALAVFVLIAVDVAAVPAVLPSVRVELGSSSSGLVWVQAAYLLAMAVVLLLLSSLTARPTAQALPGAARLALAGAGVTAFAGGALLASTADSTATLVTGRTLQGAGVGAMLVPALAGLRAAAATRGLLALVAAGALLALAVAPLVGGAIAEGASWRWLFRAEIVAALPVLLLAAASGGAGQRRPLDRHTAALDDSRTAAPDDRRTGALDDGGTAARDGGGAAALAFGLILAVTGLIQSGPWGWGSADTLLLVFAGAVLLFVALRNHPGGWDVAFVTVAGCLAVSVLLSPQYLELVRGLSPLRSGVLTATITVSAATLAALSRLLGERLPPRLPLVGGLACAALGGLGMTRIDPASSYALVIVSSALLGSGIGSAGGALVTGTATTRLAAAP